jgi:hypothetical protein
MNPRFDIQISNDLRQEIIDFSINDNNDRYFDINKTDRLHKRRKFCIISNYPELLLTTKIKEFADYAYSKIGVETFIAEHVYGNFIGVNFEGGSVHEHRDPKNDRGFIHTRFNFLLQKPEEGGEPIIDGVIYPMEEGQGWINLASEWLHGSTPVIGTKPRVVLSLGAYVHPGVIKYITDLMG